MRISFLKFLLPLWALQATAIAAPVPGATATPATASAGFEQTAKPFIEQNCMACHGPKKAKAGFRIDLLGTDFAAPAVADHWKEVIDRIGAGEMPPEGSPRPDAKQAATFITWVNDLLQQTERAAKNAGGRIPMRRLNRD